MSGTFPPLPAIARHTLVSYGDNLGTAGKRLHEDARQAIARVAFTALVTLRWQAEILMADKFITALEELRDALTAGEDVDAALAAVAADHDLKPEALHKRAVTAWGDLTDLGATKLKEELARIEQDRESDAVAIYKSVLRRPLSAMAKMTSEERNAANIALQKNRGWRLK